MEPDSLTRPFWEAARAGVLTMPRCQACGRAHFYPRPFCPHCGGGNLQWVVVDPSGVLVACTTVRRAPSPAFADDVPYGIGKIRLDAGPSLLGRIDDGVGGLQAGDRARIGFRQQAESWPLVVLRPSGA